MQTKTIDRWLAAEARLDEAVTRIATDESGEGVISSAIAVLIMAFLGAAMWLAFNGVFTAAAARIAELVRGIGG